MATVYYQKEEQGGDQLASGLQGLGAALRSIADGVNYRRSNVEAEDMMNRIASTKTRAEAMQVISKASSRLLRDEKLFARVQSFLEAFQPGENALQVYDKTTGSLKMMPYKVGTVPTENDFDAYNARLEPFEEYFVKILNPAAATDPGQAPYAIEPLGKLGSRNDATKRAFDILDPALRDSATILNLKEADGERKDLENSIKLAVQNRTAVIQQARNQIQRDRLDVSKEALEYSRNQGKTQLGKLQEDFTNGRINKSQYQAAVKKHLESRVFRSAMDRVVVERTDDLTKQRSAIEQFIGTANTLHDAVAKGGPQLGTVGKVLRTYDSAISQLKSVAEINGISAKNIDSYEWPKGLASASAGTKSLILSLTMARLAMEGQTGRSVTDRDLQLFDIGESGSPGQMLQMLDTIITDASSKYFISQNTFADRYGLDRESPIANPFSVYGNEKKRTAANKLRQMESKYKLNPFATSGANKIEIESQVREALEGINPGLFDEDEEEE